MTGAVGIFGGSFDPPHAGHLLTAAHVLSTGEISELWVIPTYQHPLGKPLSDFTHRLAMCELAFSDLRRCVVSDLERELGGVSYTVHLLEALASRAPGRRMRLVMGTDLLSETHRWRDFERVRALAPPLLVRRGGHPHLSILEDAPAMPEVSSSDARARIADGKPLAGRVPQAVVAYARTHGLYGRGQ